MFWEAAVMFITLCKELYNKHGLITVDSHPWNVTFDGRNPVFYDFSSLTKGDKINKNWIVEFEQYFALPIRLASFSKRTYTFSLELRREHQHGFGRNLLKKKFPKELINRNFQSIYNYKSEPNKVFDRILEWLQKNKPLTPKPEYWSSYGQFHNTDFDNPKTEKQIFAHKILRTVNPKTVLDLAANKGYYAIMADKLGASVLAFDYEEETVDKCRQQVAEYGTQVTSALMDFNAPTPASGIGLLVFKNSFERLGSDLVLALGLIHHICLVQRIPVFLFCEICKKYAVNGILLEFVDPSDLHVKEWNVEIPIDYNIEQIKNYMLNKFPSMEKSEEILDNGLNRQILYFHKK